MQDEQNRKATPDEKIAYQARQWRACDKAAIGTPGDETKQAEYRARQKLREVVDTVGRR
jgi:hypothetical protein